MAVIKFGALVADIRGKVGDNVFSRGQGGPIIRSVGLVDSPDSEQREICRGVLEGVANDWSSTLTETQRRGWKSYAACNPRPNRWGGRTIHSGYLAFLRHNLHAQRLYGKLTYPDAPTAGPLHPPLLTATIQQEGALQSVAVTNPLTAETYLPYGTYQGLPYWKATPAGGVHYLFKKAAVMYLNPVLGVTTGVQWLRDNTFHGNYYPSGGATGTPHMDWNVLGNLARVMRLPANYAGWTTSLDTYVFAGLPIGVGRAYYSGPWKYLTTVTYDPAVGDGPEYVPWPTPMQVGQTTRLYAVTQDKDTGVISTKGFITPTIGTIAT